MDRFSGRRWAVLVVAIGGRFSLSLEVCPDLVTACVRIPHGRTCPDLVTVAVQFLLSLDTRMGHPLESCVTASSEGTCDRRTFSASTTSPKQYDGGVRVPPEPCDLRRDLREWYQLPKTTPGLIAPSITDDTSLKGARARRRPGSPPILRVISRPPAGLTSTTGSSCLSAMPCGTTPLGACRTVGMDAYHVLAHIAQYEYPVGTANAGCRSSAL